MTRMIWFMIAILALVVGLVGIFLPLLPTAPLLLLSAYGFARSSERMHNWLLAHPRLGPPISDWRERGAIGRRSKRFATVSILAAFGLSFAFGLKPALLWLQGVVLAAVVLFIWTRPNA